MTVVISTSFESVSSSDPEIYDEDSDSEEDFSFFPICSKYTSNFSISHKSVEEALKYDREEYDFNLLEFLPSDQSEEFYEKTIVCVNKSREFISSISLEDSYDNKSVGRMLSEYLKSSPSRDDEIYFSPVLVDDAMLMHMDDIEELQRNRMAQVCLNDEQKKIKEFRSSNRNSLEIEMKVASLQEQLANAKNIIKKLTMENNSSDKYFDANMTEIRNEKKSNMDNDSYYFNSYSFISIHETMIQDKVRTEAYRNAILSNSLELFKGKIILDIGCGTGILSLFAAQAGAKKVISIDASNICREASAVADLNGYGDIIVVLQGKVEDLIERKKIPLNDNDKVDVIISEWMGFALFYEMMLPSVLLVRDKFMDRNTGIMYPNRCAMYIEGAKDSRLEFWNNVYGINMLPIRRRFAKELMREVNIEIIKQDSIVTERCLLLDWDLNICTNDELDFEVSFKLIPIFEGNTDNKKKVSVDKIVISFDVYFDAPGTKRISFSTGCHSKSTHWKQAVIYLDHIENTPNLKRDEVMTGTFSMKRSIVNHRDIEFFIQWQVGNKDGDYVKRCSGISISNLGF